MASLRHRSKWERQEILDTHVRNVYVNLHKSGNGYKTICSELNVPESAFKAIMKKFKTIQTSLDQ